MDRVMHFEFPADDPERSCDFYRMVFGWTFQKSGNADYWMAKTGSEQEPGINGGIMKKKDPDQPVTVMIEVADLKKTLERIEQHEGAVVVPITALPNMGYFAYFKDPEGIIVGVMQKDPKAA